MAGVSATGICFTWFEGASSKGFRYGLKRRGHAEPSRFSQKVVIECDRCRSLLLLCLGSLLILQFPDEMGQTIFLPGRVSILVAEVQIISKPLLIRSVQIVRDGPDSKPLTVL